MLVWTGEGWEHGAILLSDADVVVDWTASQFVEDAAKAAMVPVPCIEARTEPDARWGESYVLEFESAFLRAARNLLPEPMLEWRLAKERIEQRDPRNRS